MERIKRLGRYQKGVLLFMIAMVLVFAVLYSITIAREGFAYQGAILVPSSENGTTVYSGKIQGKQASFAVGQDKTVYFQYGGKTYGPYTAVEDAAFIPKESEMRDAMVGVELRHGEEILFRGGVLDYGNYAQFYNEEGEIVSFRQTVVEANTGTTTVLDEHGNVVDPMEPSVSTLLDLMDGPRLTHKGDWAMWFYGVLICIVTAISILFADELFRWSLSFQIRDADRAEPSDWEIATRYIAWTLCPILAMGIFVVGLQ